MIKWIMIVMRPVLVLQLLLLLISWSLDGKTELSNADIGIDGDWRIIV